MVFRNKTEYLTKRRKWFSNSLIGDWPLTLSLSLQGKIYYMPDVMAVYRKHSGGNYSNLDVEKRALAVISVFEPALKFFPVKYKRHIKTHLNGLYAYMLASSIRNKDPKQIKDYLKKGKIIKKNIFEYLLFLARVLFSFIKNFTFF